MTEDEMFAHLLMMGWRRDASVMADYGNNKFYDGGFVVPLMIYQDKAKKRWCRIELMTFGKSGKPPVYFYSSMTDKGASSTTFYFSGVGREAIVRTVEKELSDD